MIRKKSLTWTHKPSDQLNLAHVARKKYDKEETKTNASAHLVEYRFGSVPIRRNPIHQNPNHNPNP